VLANTANEVDLSTGNMVEGLLEGYDLVAENHEFDGWAVDTRFRGQLARAQVARDVNGNVANPAGLNLASTSGELLGVPAHCGRGAGGYLGEAPDSGFGFIGGGFSLLRYGYANRVRVKGSDTAIIDGVSMWQPTPMAFLIEVTFGWVLGSPDAF